MNMQHFGDIERFGFELAWSDEARADASASEATRGRLTAWLNGVPVWASQRGLETKGVQWTWIELLEHLAAYWPRISRETLPHEYSGLQLGTIEIELAGKLDDGTIPDSDDIEQKAWEFVEAHDLARGQPGIALTPLRIVRMGNDAVVATAGSDIVMPWKEVESVLVNLSEAILERLKIVLKDERAAFIRRSWRDRLDIAVEEWAEICSGVPFEELRNIETAAGRQIIPDTLGAGEESHLLAAARMAFGTIWGDDWRTLMDSVVRARDDEVQVSRKLKILIGEAREKLAGEEDLRSYEQGYAVAEEIRPALPDGTADGPLDMENVFAALGIAVKHLNFRGSAIDAVLVWSRNHNAVVFINKNGQHAQESNGLNATLAHELCHILIDHGNALPLVEVTGGNSPPRVESRAKAFAAEILFPRVVATREAENLTLDNYKMTLQAVSSTYRSSRRLIAWQLHNRCRKQLDPALLEELKRFAASQNEPLVK